MSWQKTDHECFNSFFLHIYTDLNVEGNVFSFFLNHFFIIHIQTLHITFYKTLFPSPLHNPFPLCTGQRWTTSFDTKIKEQFFCHERDSYSNNLMLVESVLRFTVPNKQGSEVYEFQANPLSKSYKSFPLNLTP